MEETFQLAWFIIMSTTRAPPGSTHRILIFDALELFRIGLTEMIRAAGRFTVCATTADHAQIAPLIERHRPHLLIADPFQQSGDGVVWTKNVAARFPETKILIVSLNPEMAYAERALRAGASGYWMKSGTADGLLEAIDRVLKGELFVSRRVNFLALHKWVDHPLAHFGNTSVLSRRELQVFALLGAEHGCGEIAQELGISRKTVETHFEHIKAKLGYPNAAALQRGARELMAVPA